MKLLVLDGNSILNRAFYGIKLLTTKSGKYTNAIYGFLTMFQKVKDETNPDAVAIAFDLRAPTFRHKEFDGYKANRKGMPEELAQQMPVLKELLNILGYKCIECEGYEADDILGTLAKCCEDNNNECIIATGDRDSLQLVTKNVSVRITATKMGRPDVTLYDEEKIMETYGVTPKQLIDIKAIQGDSSDNIPGVPGIGQKGASDLIQRFSNIDYIYENIDTIDIKEGMKKKLIAGKDSAYMSRMLGTIVKNVPIDTDIAEFIPKEINKAEALKLMKELEFFSLIKKMGLEETSSKKEINEEIKLEVNSNIENLISILKKDKKAVFNCEFEDGLIKSICFYACKTFYIVNKKDDLLNIYKNVFEDELIKKQTYNVKQLFSALLNENIDLKNVDFDIMLAGYLLNPSSSKYDIETLSNEYDVNYNNDMFILEEHNKLVKDTMAIYKLVNIMEEKIIENFQSSLLKEIEIPLSKVLADMENIGFGVDINGIKEYGIMLGKQILELEEQIYNIVGYTFNINSPKQLGVALFEKMGLPFGKKTKTGYSTNAEVLESIRYIDPVVDLILEYRTLSKLKSTYCDGMLKVISKDGRIHSNFNQTETKTGRISSTEPNLQNIPFRTEIGRELRKFFLAKEGCVLVDADYSQIELRVLAHISNDENMINAFKNNDDIHTITASQVFKVPESMITPLIRGRAKAVNFGIVYGIGAFSLSKDIGSTVKEADRYIKDYFIHYPGVNQYMNNIVEKAKETGYVSTMFNRRRYLPELKSSNFNLRSFGERVARNMPIQGTAADIIKIAMINVENRIKKENLKSKIILQVHDELIIESPNEESEIIKDLLTKEMERAVKLSVPLVAEASVGKTWYDAK